MENFIDISKLKNTYKSRKEETTGHTFIVLDWEGLESLYNKFLFVNKELEKYFKNAYEPYYDNIHITIIGMNEYDSLDFEEKKVAKGLIENFPKIEIETFKIKIDTNGLVVAEIIPSKESKKILSCYRKQFEIIGIKYKYPDHIEQLHSVLGIFNPEYINSVKDTIWEKAQHIIDLSNECSGFDKDSVYIKRKNTFFIQYRKRSLVNIDIFFQDLIDSYIKSDSEDINVLKNRLKRISKFAKREHLNNVLERRINTFKKDAKKNKIDKNKFWRSLDLQIIYDKSSDTQEYNFSEYNFPEFNNSSFLAFFDDKNNIHSDKPLIFLKSKFYGKVKLKKAVFEKKVSFNLAIFYETVEIKSCRFLKETYFRKTYFIQDADFEASRFENVTLDSITFPKNGKIKMVRTTFEHVIWSNFINPTDILKIESERETFSRLKQANSERGNFIDSNLFFVEESNIYLRDVMHKLFCIPKSNIEDENPNKKCPSWLKKFGFIGDFISFGIAKITSNFGKSWILPLIWFVTIFAIALFIFTPNKDFVATPSTPKFLTMLDKNKTKSSKIYNISDAYYRKNYYSGYDFEFQGDSAYKLKDTFATRSMYVFGSLAPTVLSSNHWFNTITRDRFIYRAILTILFWYFIGAFLYALKNRTKRN